MKKIIFFLLAVSFYAGVFGQVNYQSGGATFGLPMFNWKDDKSRLSFDVSLSYSSGYGLKVNDVSSNIGQGWNLAAGGAVSRMQIGQPDDQKPYLDNGTYDNLTKYPAGYLYNPINPVNGCPPSLTKYPIFEWKNQVYKQHNTTGADREQDRFAFNINGRAGFFVLGKNNGDKGVLFEDSKLKIWFIRNESLPGSAINQGIRTTITAFYIQDENGFIYKFDQCELTKVLQVNYCDANLTQAQTQPELNRGNTYHDAAFDNNNLVNPYVVTTWYLSQIKDPLTQRVINITYRTPENIFSNAGTSISFYEEKDYAIISHNFSKTQTPVISSVSFPDGHVVNFNYGAERIDLPGDLTLSSVDVTYQGRYLSKYELNPAYFILNRVGTPVNAFQKSVARLCLQSVKKYGVDLKDEEPPYKFEYFTGSTTIPSAEPNENTLGLPEDIVPPPFSHIKDIWGYYNGNNSKAYDGTTYVPIHKPLAELGLHYVRGICFSRPGSNAVALNTKPGYAKNGLLKKIIYPTGGTLSYEYAQNVGKINSQTVNAGGVHVLSTSVTDGSVSSGKPNDCGNPIVTNFTYTDDAGQPSLWGLENPVNQEISNSHYEPEKRTFKWWGPGCKWVYQYPGIISREQAVSLTGHQQFLIAFSKAMEILSAITTVVDIINVCLSATPAAIIAIIIDIILIAVGIIITCTDNASQDFTSTVYFNSDRNNANPLPMQFKQVTVTESSGGNGKTVMKFTSQDNYSLWEPTNLNFSMKQRYAHYCYGLPLNTTVYDVNNFKIKESINTYDFSYAQALDGHPGSLYYRINRFVSCKCDVKKSYSQRNTDWDYPANLPYQTSSDGDMKVEMYDNQYGYIKLTSTTERYYKPASSTNYLETITGFNYNFNYLVNQINKTESNGDQVSKYISYNTDYTGGALTTLNQNNIFSIPVSTTNRIIKSGDIYSQVINELVNEYTALSNGDIKLSRTLEQRFSEPTQSFTGYQGPGNAGNPFYKETQTLTYDASSNLIGLKDEGNHVVTNLYGYNDKYVIASVVNATPVVDKVAYTSFEDGGLGGWNITGTSTVVSTSAVTGAKSLSLGTSNTITANLTSGKPYTLSFWSTIAGGISVSNGTLVKTSPVFNGYTCYEYSITPGTTITITNSTAKNIDELRLYPQMARMRTVTYDPLIGKTSECDENNRATYYEYDNLGRLRFIKDDLKNIVKMYEYNYASKQNGCTASFSNPKISEIFYKNNCTTGYIGAPYTYTIPAGKYTSAVSQEIVDGFVQNELETLGQTAANTSGTCIQQWGNSLRTQAFAKENCPAGYLPTNVNYTVPANRYFSTISQADANAKRDADIKANGQAFANASSTANCTITTTAQWVSTDLAQCEIVSGNYTGNQLTEFIDENPNSSTYNTRQWINTGVTNTAACSGVAKLNITYTNNTATTPRVTFTNTLDDLNYFDNNFGSSTSGTAGNIPAGTYNIRVNPFGFTGVYTFTYQVGAAAPVSVTGSTVLNLPVNATINMVILSKTYYNVFKTQVFTKSNCPAGYYSNVTYSIPIGTYTSTISQADADAKAQNDINVNGQAFADANGVCALPTVSITGNTSFTIGTPSGNGIITGTPGYTVSVTIYANGSSSFTLTASVPGVTITGNTSVTNGTSIFTFVMPASGTVNWSATLTAPNSAGGGYISVN